MLQGLQFPSLNTWLQHTPTISQDQRYHHNLLIEYLNHRTVALSHLKSMITTAHDDARLRLRKVLEIDSLHPLEEEDAGEEALIDPASDYPNLFDMNTLKGY